MRSEFIRYKSSLVHYYFLDRGSRVMVCFHGYDESGSAFEIMKDVLPSASSVLAIDLPFHGKTEWDPATTFEAAVLWEILLSIFSKHRKMAFKLEIAGFSMGGRIALSLLEHQPSNIERMVLLAPDGLKFNFWYWITTRTYGGQKLFRHTMKHPAWLLLAMRIGRKLGMINQSIFKFTYYHLKEPAGRKLLYDRWMAMRWMRPEISNLKQKIRNQEIPVLLIYGSFDRIMPAASGKKFSQDTDELCKVEMIACGHQIMQPKNKKNLLKIFRRLKF